MPTAPGARLGRARTRRALGPVLHLRQQERQPLFRTMDRECRSAGQLSQSSNPTALAAAGLSRLGENVTRTGENERVERDESESWTQAPRSATTSPMRPSTRTRPAIARGRSAPLRLGDRAATVAFREPGLGRLSKLCPGLGHLEEHKTAQWVARAPH